MNTELIYNKRLEEAKELLAEILTMLNTMTTEDFSHGKDFEVRQKIMNFLGLEHE